MRRARLRLSRSRATGHLPARELLGREHPLVRLVEWRMVVARQSVVAAALLVASVGAAADSAAWAPVLALSAVIVLATLGLLAAALWRVERRRALDVIIEGRESVPVVAVQRQRRRLLSRHRQACLARTFERFLEEAVAHRPLARSARPWFDVRVVRMVAPELRIVIARLRAGSSSARAVAIAERLITDGCGVLYGHDVIALRAALDRVIFPMSSLEQSGPAGADGGTAANASNRPPWRA
jgi:hypothetical protein